MSSSVSDTGHRELIGQLRSECEVGGFTISNWISPASAPAIEPHGHATAHFVIVTAGCFNTEAEGDNRSGPLVIFNPAGTYHADHFSGRGAFVGIMLSQALGDRVGELSLPRDPVRLCGTSAFGLGARIARAASAKASLEAETVESLCLELVGEAERGSPPGGGVPSWLGRAADYLRDGENESGVEGIARAVGVHPVHLTRSFRRHFGCTPGDYLRMHRVTRAANLLLHNRATIAAIAADCAFADQSHLVRSFRRQYGMTPQQFRLAAT